MGDRGRIKKYGKAWRKTFVDPAQLGLFDTPPAPNPSECAAATSSLNGPAARARGTFPTQARAQRPARQPLDEPHLVALGDMPSYPPPLVDDVERAIKLLPTDRAFLCYKEIRDYFGVSKSNVVRKMREGLVPGVRLASGRVVEDGPVRRLDRSQLKWLLLAIRAGRNDRGALIRRR